jgi:hypothetical protein
MVDASPMPDLSEMLGDVYGSDDEEAPPAPATGPSTPAWADDEHLDRAFAQWTPGPGADAPAAERGMFAPAPSSAPSHLAHDLAAALSEAVLAETDDVEDEDDADDQPTKAAVSTTAVTEASAEPAEPEVERLTPSTLTQLEPEPAPIPVPVHKAGWQRSDDDILPTGKVAKGGVRLPRPARAGTAPKGPKGDVAPKKQRRSLGDLMKMEIGGKKKK